MRPIPRKPTLSNRKALDAQGRSTIEYILPHLPLGSAEYTVVRWLKRAGEPVAAGEPLLVVVNDRLEAALPAPQAGSFERALAAEGAVVAAGAPVAALTPMVPATTIGRPSAQIASTRPATISPAARSIAKLDTIDITLLHGTGVAGRIMKADVLAARANQPLEPVNDSNSQAPPPIHQSATPYVLTAIDVDLERVAVLIAQQAASFARRRLELSYLVCVALAAAEALPYHRLLNSYWAEGLIVARRWVHLAVVPRGGSPVRTICHAQDLNLRGIARGFGGIAAEQGSDDRTFTIVDFSEHSWGDPVAQALGRAAALGVGAVRARPLAIAEGDVDRLAIHHAALLTLAYDARVVDQCYADAFLRDIKRRMEHFHI